VAIEISVSTSAIHELGNITKCLAAGFSHAILAATDERTLVAARRELSVVDDRLRFVLVQDLASVLDALIAGPMAVPKGPSKRSGLPSPTTGGKRPMLGTHEAADYLKIARQTLAKFRVTGEGPAFYKLGRQVVYDPDDLDRWTSEKKRRSTSDRGSPPRR
jgi:hypothetical protein